MSDPKKIQAIMPLAPMQQGMLYHAIRFPESQAYFEQIQFKLKGTLDVNLLEDSLNTLIKKHAILRTVFVYQNMQIPKQVVLHHRKIKIHYDNLGSMSGHNQENFIHDFIRHDKEKQFDLQKEILIRFSVLQLSKNVYQIVFSFHHIIFDGWSLGLFLKELFGYYQSITENVNAYSELSAPLFSHFIDWIKKQDQQVSLNYWEKYLNALSVQTKLPGEVLEQRSGTRFSESISVIDNDLTQSLNQLASEINVTLNTLFQTIWGILLQKYNNTNDVVFGSVVSGRNKPVPGIENILGLFINTIPVRIQCDPSDTFVDIVQQIQTNAIESANHDWLSLSDIQQKSDLKDQLISHIMAFENYPMDSDLQGLLNGGEAWGFHVSDFQIFEQTNYDFNLIVIPGETITLKVLFNQSKFNIQMIESIIMSLQYVLNQILMDKEISVRLLNITPPEIREFILNKWNATDKYYPLDMSVPKFFGEQAEKHPEKIAVEFENISISYRCLDMKSNQFANYLLKNNIGSGDIVGVCLNRSIEFVIAILGIQKAGATYLPLDITTPTERIKYIMSQSHMTGLIKSENIDFCNLECIVFNFTQMNLDAYSTCLNNTEVISGDLAYIIFTSGSTGKPKGVKIGHQGLINMIYQMGQEFNYTKSDIVSQISSPGFDASVLEIWPCLCHGATLKICPQDVNKDPVEMKNWLIKNKVTCTFQSTLFAEKFISDEWPQNCQIRLMLTGGDKLNHFPISHVPFSVYNLYGPTESTVFSSWSRLKPVDDKKALPDIGYPIPNHRIYILNHHMQLQPPGFIGEIYIAGKGLAKGYLNSPKLTKEKFLRDPFYLNDKMYKTGDLAKWTKEGKIQYIGRNDQQVQIGGHRIELSEIENVLKSYDEISDAVVLTENKINDITVFYTGSHSIDVVSLKEKLKTFLPHYMIPKWIIPLDAFPINKNGKIDRKKLLDMSGESSQTEEIEEPRNEVEKEIYNAWKEVLNIQRFDIHKHFAELGGDSIKAISIQGILNKKYSISIQQIYENPTVASLATALNGKYKNLNQQIDQIEENLNSLIFNKKVSCKSLKSELFQPDVVENISTNRYEHILLTGATGFLGVHLFYQLLTSTSSYITCLVQGETDESARSRFVNNFTFYFSDIDLLDYYQRFQVVAGNIIESNLGFNDNFYNTLTDSIDCILNSAAIVKHYGNDNDFYKTNVMGVGNLLRFASKRNKKTVYHVSTLSVGINEINELKAFRFTETYEIKKINLANPYLKTKIMAEQLLKEQLDKGLKVVNLRVGNIMYNSHSGIFQRNLEENAFFQSMRTFLDLGMIPDLPHRIFDLSHVDDVSKAIVFLMHQQNDTFSYHIFNPDVFGLSQLANWFILNGQRINLVTISHFLNELRCEMNNGKYSSVQKLLLFSPYFQHNELFCFYPQNDYTNQILFQGEFMWNKIDTLTINRMLQSFMIP